MKAEHLQYLHENKWIINRQGQQFVTFKGLLWLAHQMGLVSLKSTPVHEDLEKGTFFFRAVATGYRTVEGERVLVEFEDEGDATVKNVGKMIIPHVRRMASTRAMARVLRIYTGLGITAIEELG